MGMGGWQKTAIFKEINALVLFAHKNKTIIYKNIMDQGMNYQNK